MKKFIIERNLPGAGQLSTAELKAIAQTSCNAVLKMDSYYQWLETFVTGDKMYCIHIAESEEAVRKHTKMCNFPINSVNEIVTVFDPMTSVN